MKKFFNIYFGEKLEDRVLDNINNVLNCIFAVRYTKIKITPEAAWIDQFTKDCTYKDDQISFDARNFILKILHKSSKSHLKSDFFEFYENIIEKMNNPPQHYINGHDAVKLLCWLGKNRKRNSDLCKEHPVHRALLTSLESEYLLKHQLFVDISEWATNSA